MLKKRKLQEAVAMNKVSIPDLILLCLFSLTNSRKKEASFERLLSECFRLAPKTFSFLELSRWPDARKIGRPLRTLRKRGLIKGSPAVSFSLTSKGKRAAEEVAKLLRQKKLFQD